MVSIIHLLNSVTRRTMERYYRSMDTVPYPEFMDEFDSIKTVTQMFLPIVSSTSAIDKVVSGLDIKDNRK